MPDRAYETFEEVKLRLDEIVKAVDADDLPLDEALALYEEAVGLGLRASDLLEANIEAHRAAEDEAARCASASEAPKADAAGFGAGAVADAAPLPAAAAEADAEAADAPVGA